MSTIKEITVRKIIDSRGKPTVEADIITSHSFGRAAAPSGASTGKHEVVTFPDNNVDGAIKTFNSKYKRKLLGFDTSDQEAFDSFLHEIDGTDNFAKLGGSVAIALSIATAKSEATYRNQPLYRYLAGKKVRKIVTKPFGNVLGGGKHAIGGTDIQEYLAVSFGKSFSDSVFGNAGVHSALGKLLKDRFGTVGKGDEGGWVAGVSNRDAMELVAQACKEASGKFDLDIHPSLDVAASSFFENGRYTYKEGAFNQDEQIEFMVDLIDKYHLHSIEDPLDEEDYEGFKELTKKVGKKCIIIGDDIFVTSTERLKKGIAMRAGNAVLVKPNQCGTLTETIAVIRLAHRSGFKTVLSHRSGETIDDTIAHIAVAFECHGIKTGTVGGERIAKLNELIRIEEQIMVK